MSGKGLSPKTAADYIEREWHLRVSPSTVRRWVERGALPAARDARGRARIDPADLHVIFDAPRAMSVGDTW